MSRLVWAVGRRWLTRLWRHRRGGPDDEPDYPREPAYLVLARVLLAQNDPGPA